MPTIYVTTREGEEKAITGELGMSVMEAMRDAGIDDLLALCGGCLSCATCHVHVDEHGAVSLPPMSADEDELLGGLNHRTPRSRLSCQLQIGNEANGLRVTIAPEE